jgi:hypothetical protein
MGKEIIENGKTEVQVVGNSPAEMIRMAVSGGADLEQLEKLLELQERWEAKEAHKAYNKAIAAFKSVPLEIDKDKKVSYGQTSYNHASLANVVKKVTEELSKHGLSASFNTHQNGKIKVTCRISHVAGHFEETSLEADADTSGSKNSIQALGSTITYLERYTLLAALGLATKDQDDDGKAVTARITNEQLGQLRDLLISIGEESKEGVIAKAFKIADLSELSAADFKRAETVIISRGEAKKKAEAK